MVKISLIGAGSIHNAIRLTCGVLSHPELSAHTDSIISLMDINEENLNLASRLIAKIVQQARSDVKIESTTDRCKSLQDADYVINTIQVGGVDAWALDIEVPFKYGVKQAIGDTLGPGGIFRALRTIPVILDICRDMEELCPDALFLNISNPMAMNCWAMNEYTNIKNIGLCHSPYGTPRTLARYIGAPPEEVSALVAGINHMAWVLEFKWRGEDAYPLLREKMKDPEVYTKDMVRFEIMKHFGYFVTESSHHNSEYVPYFRKSEDLIEKYKITMKSYSSMEQWREKYKKRAEIVKNALEQKDIIKFFAQRGIDFKRPTGFFYTEIIHAIETDTPIRVNANVKNVGLITNLPPRCIVEVPCLIDGTGVHPCYVGDLPSQCAALNRTNINVQELAVKAAVEGDRTLALQAVLMDPLTRAVLSLEETEKMVEEMFKKQAQYLPSFSEH